MGTQAVVLRHEDVPDGVMPGFGQRKADRLGFVHHERVRNLDQDACAVARNRVSADGAAMFQVLEDAQCVDDRCVRATPFHVRNEPDAACVELALGVIEALRGRLRRHLVGTAHGR